MSKKENKKGTCQNGETGPGYASPLDAMKGPKEKLLYIPCIYRNTEATEPDYLATIDVDEESSTFCQVIHRLEMPNLNDELHRCGWNTCSSCYHDSTKKRKWLILAGLVSSRLYAVNVESDPKQPRLEKTISPTEIHFKTGLANLHTIHCAPEGKVIISTFGDPSGNEKCGFLIVDAQTFKLDGKWEFPGNTANFGCDFYYQPRHNVLVSSEWGSPKKLLGGFDPTDVAKGFYGHSMKVWDFETHELKQVINLGAEGNIPLELRFLHEPTKAEGYVASALAGNIFRFYKTENGDWAAEKVISIPSKKVKNWILPEMPCLLQESQFDFIKEYERFQSDPLIEFFENGLRFALTTFLLISLDDKYLYIANWLHGDVRQYDIADTKNPKLVGQIFLGGSICKGEGVKVIEDKELDEQPSKVHLGGKPVEGGPQMMQLSLDGKRLYVTTSLYSAWDKQFYPKMIKSGSFLLRVEVDNENGGLSLNEKIFVDFGKEPKGPSLAEEIRYPGGDCTSEIWM